MSEERDEWDGPWKESLESLDLVFDLFWPDVLLEADLARGWQSLAQELQKLTPDASTGLLRVDKLFELYARESGDPRLAHFEAQMQKDLQLPVRMHRYSSRGRDHFNQPIASFAILGDDDPNWLPTEHSEGVFRCEQTTRFRSVKLIRWRPFLSELEAGANLFGLFVCAHLETMRTKGNVEVRKDAKFRLLANLMRRDISPTDLQRWYRLIDWIVKLPEDANRAVWLRLEELKEPKPMSHITFAEIYGREKGIKESLRELILAKFPQEGPALCAEFESEVSVDRLKALLRAAGLALSVEDFPVPHHHSDWIVKLPEDANRALSPAAERKAYHTEQAALAEKAKQHFARAFHFGRLLLDDPDNADLKKRRAAALKAHAEAKGAPPKENR